MNRKHAFLLVFVFVLFAFSLSVFAKGSFAKVTITAPDLEQPIEVTDPEQLVSLGMVELMDIFEQVEAPANPGTGYELTRFGLRGAEYDPFDQVIYYPGEGDQPAYVYYVGIINGGSEFDGNWYAAAEAGETMMQQILSQHGIAVEAETASPVRQLRHWILNVLNSLQGE